MIPRLEKTKKLKAAMLPPRPLSLPRRAHL